jgi:tRNA A-37 threonylcarbamoyl transferase component Bud32
MEIFKYLNMFLLLNSVKFEDDNMIKEVDSSFIENCLDNKDYTRLNSGRISHAIRLTSKEYDVVVKLGDKSSSSFRIESLFFGKYVTDRTALARHNYEQKKIVDLYLDGFNVVEPLDVKGLYGLVLTQYNPATNFGLSDKPKFNDYLQVISNLNKLHQNSIYHGDPHLNNIFYDENLTWFDFDTKLDERLSFDGAAGRDLRITLLSMLKKTDDGELVSQCFKHYKGQEAKDFVIYELEEVFDPATASSYVGEGFGNPVTLKKILKGEK